MFSSNSPDAYLSLVHLFLNCIFMYFTECNITDFKRKVILHKDMWEDPFNVCNGILILDTCLSKLNIKGDS